MKRYDLSREAQQDLTEIHEYTTERWGEKQAQKYLTQLRKQLCQLAEMPTLGQPRPELDDNIFSFPCTSHMIYFTITESGVAVAGILHKRMLPELHLRL